VGRQDVPRIGRIAQQRRSLRRALRKERSREAPNLVGISRRIDSSENGVSEANTVQVLRPMAEADLQAAHMLSVEVGWPHRPEDWRLVHELGHGIVACDSAGRVNGCAMWWSHGDAVGTIGMVIVSPRLQKAGLGRRMLRHLIDETGPRTLRLNATAAGLALYESEGFVAIGAVHQHQGVAVAASVDPAAAGRTAIRPLRDEDWPRLSALDATAYGADRSRLFEALVGRATGFVGEVAGTIDGFALCRRFGRGHVVGPIVAMDDSMAVALLQPHLLAHSGTFLRLDTPVPDGAFTRALERVGLIEVSTVVSMARGEHRTPAAPHRLYAILNQALG
jgi:GNAT superfamily N-acetyltransferase